jgi:hypothetical protein
LQARSDTESQRSAIHKSHELTAIMLLNGKSTSQDVVRSFLKLQLNVYWESHNKTRWSWYTVLCSVPERLGTRKSKNSCSGASTRNEKILLKHFARSSGK